MSIKKMNLFIIALMRRDASLVRIHVDYRAQIATEMDTETIPYLRNIDFVTVEQVDRQDIR